MNKRYPMLLFPCFRLQDRMQKSTLGENHWLMLHKRLYQRLKLENYQVRVLSCQLGCWLALRSPIRFVPHQRKHNGAMPAMSFVGSVKKFFGFDHLDIYEP